MRSNVHPLCAVAIAMFAGMASAACKSGDGATAAGASLSASSASAPSAAAPKRFGAAIGSSRPVALAAIAHDPSAYVNQQVVTEGRVTAVCQARGCWMELVQEGRSEGASQAQAHVKMHGHSFSVPRDASGRRARIEATVIGSPGQGECEREAEQQTGRAAKVALVATGVELM